VVGIGGRQKHVLEAGCGPSSITKLLVTEGQCRLAGIKWDRSAIEKVRPFCEELLRADLKSPTWPELVAEKERFDLVVAAEVLEHLYDPWSTLKLTKSLLAYDGYLVIPFPMSGTLRLLQCLFTGDFDYRDLGLLDRTHIRFFGLRNIEQLFEQAQLKLLMHGLW
jgi:2-polyprenyl-3-methyl-5-hydroxy-6-metoxy-1,4-benzoquinol methylase